MYYCPCCADVLLKHINASQTYWFCRTCWQEMPILTWPNYASLAAMSAWNQTPREKHSRRDRLLCPLKQSPPSIVESR